MSQIVWSLHIWSYKCTTLTVWCSFWFFINALFALKNKIWIAKDSVKKFWFQMILFQFVRWLVGITQAIYFIFLLAYYYYYSRLHVFKQLFLWWSGDLFMCSNPWHYSSIFTEQREKQTLVWQSTSTLQAERQHSTPRLEDSHLLRWHLTGTDNWHLPQSAPMLRSCLDVKFHHTSNISPLLPFIFDWSVSVSLVCGSLYLLPRVGLDGPHGSRDESGCVWGNWPL